MTSNKQFEELMESVNSGIVVLQNEKIVYINGYAARGIGLPKSDIIGKNLLEFVPPEDHDLAKKRFAGLLKNKETVKSFETKLIDSKGRVRVAEISSAITVFDNLPAQIISMRDVTEHKRFEKELIEKELFQESLLNSLSDVIYIYDFVEQKNIYSNNTIGEVLGYSVEEIKKFDNVIMDLMHPDDYKNYLEKIIPRYQSAKDSELIGHEYRMRPKDGEWHWFSSKESVYKRDIEGNATQIFGVLSDITERKNIRRLIEEKERQMQSIYNDPKIFIGVLDFDGNVIDANKSALDFIAKKLEDVKGVKFWDTLWWSHSKEQQELLKSAYNNAQKGISASFNAEHVNPDGDSVIVNFSIRPIKDSDGIIFNFLVEGINISDQIKAEKSMRESEKRYRALTENAPVGVWHADLEGNVIYINPTLSKISGLTADEAIGGKWGSKVHPEDRDRILKEWDEYITGEKPYTSTYRFVHDNGDIRWVLENGTTIFDDKNIKIAHIGTVTEITERITSEDKLRESEKTYRALFDQSNDAIFIMKDDMFIDCNKKTCEIFGVKEDEILNHPPYEFSPDKQPDGRDSKEKALEKINKAYDGKPQFFEWKHKKLSGELFDAEVSLNVLSLKSGKYLQAIVRDVSERKKVEERYRSLVDNIGEHTLIYTTDFEGNLKYVSPTITKKMGYSPEEFMGVSYLENLTTKEQRKNEKILNEQYTKKGKPIPRHDLEFFSKDRKKRYWLEIIENVIKDQNGIGVGIQGIARDITEQKEQEKKIEESENKFRSSLEEINLLAVMLDSEGKIIFTNDYLLNKTGWKQKEVLGKNYFDLFISKDVKLRSKRRFKEIAANKSSYNRISEMFTKEGKRLIIDWNVTIQYDDKGKLIAATSIGTDITEKLKTEADLKFQSELIKQSYESMITTDLDFKINWTNEAFTKLFGYTQEEALGKTPNFLNAESNVNEIQTAIYEAMNDGKLLRTSILNKKKDGTKFICEVAIYPVVDKNGKVVAYSGHQYDITERVKAEKALQESEDKFKSYFNNSPTGIVVCELIRNSKGDPIDFIHISGNQAVEKNTGSKLNSLIGQKASSLLPKTELSKLVKQYGSVVDEGKIIEFVEYFELYERSLNVLASKVRGDTFIIQFNDISDKINTEKNLIKSEEEKQKILQTINSGIYIYDTELNKYIYINNAYTNILGWSIKDIEKMGDKFSELYHPDDFQSVLDHRQEILNDKEDKNYHLLYRLKSKNGQWIWCESVDSPFLRDSNGDVTQYIGVFSNVSDRIQTQRELEESESKYHDLFEHQLEAYAYHEIILNKKGEAVDYKFIDVNDQFLKELNIKSKKDVIGKTLFELDPNIDKKWVKYYGEVALTGKPKKFEDRFVQNDKWYKIYAYSPKQGHFATSFIDITVEKIAEVALIESEKKFRSIADNAPDIIYHFTLLPEPKFEFVSPAVLDITGYSPKEFYKDPKLGMKIVHPADKSELQRLYQGIVPKGPHIVRWLKKDKKVIWMEDRAIPIKDENGKLLAIYGIARDITDKKEAEEELNNYKDSLEDMVEKRTTELQKKNEELDNALKVFVGRELTIKNLRNEISKLEKELKKLKN